MQDHLFFLPLIQVPRMALTATYQALVQHFADAATRTFLAFRKAVMDSFGSQRGTQFEASAFSKISCVPSCLMRR